ncbi:glycosyltransferase family 4 protein [bacterium]|nr:glycosyltransferase family 4 protein [bacterium]
MSEPAGHKPRLLLVTPYFYPQNYGGAVRLYDELLARSEKIESAVLTELLYARPETLADASARAISRGYRIRRIRRLRLVFEDLPRLARLIDAARFFPEVTRAFRAVVDEFKPDLVVCGAIYRIGWLMGRLPASIPFVNYIHGEELTQEAFIAGGPIARYLARGQRLAARNARMNIVVSRFTADRLKALANPPGDRIRILPNFVDTEKFHPPADREALRRELGFEGRTVLITIARLIPRKGIDQVLRALAASHSLPENWVYLIGGTGAAEASLRALAAELGLGERVRFLGYLAEDQLPRYHGGADVFIQTNRAVGGDTEGFGIVFLEANACGTPVIGGIAGGTADAIEEGVSGLRVDGDDAGAVRAAIEKLAGDAELRRRMGEAGLERVRSGFSADSCARRFEDLILNLIGKAGPRS